MPIIPNDTLSYVANLVNRANSAVISDPPISSATFNLDSSGVAGFFGGESSVRATATVNLVAHRRWFGWYNAPGSYEVAREYSGLAKSHIFDALFPANDSNPAKILKVDGRVGPEYTPLHLETNKAPSTIGHLGSLIARKVSQMPFASSPRGEDGIEQRRVTFVRLGRPIPPHKFSKLKLASSSSGVIFAIITILISIGGCIACALVADWFSFASIAVGIIANGVACLVIGSGELCLKYNPPAQVDTPGDVLLTTDTDLIVLVGSEGTVSPFTRGRFDVRSRGVISSITGQVARSDVCPTPPFASQAAAQSTPPPTSQAAAQPTHPPASQAAAQPTPPPASQAAVQPTPPPDRSTAPHSRRIQTFSEKYIVDFSVILLLAQFLAQLLLIPQGRLFGQLMFIATLLVSWACNSYLSSMSLDLQTNMLFDELSLSMEKDVSQYELSSRTEAVVFACLFFRYIYPVSTKEKRKKVEDVAKEAKEALVKAEHDLATKVPGTPDAKVAEMNVDEKRADQEAKMKKYVTMTKETDIALKSFQNLLNALLPSKAGAHQAFKESLMKKIGETDIDPFVDPFHRDPPAPPFGFDYVDQFITAADGGTKIIDREDFEELLTCQNDAETALCAWKMFYKMNNISTLFDKYRSQNFTKL